MEGGRGRGAEGKGSIIYRRVLGTCILAVFSSHRFLMSDICCQRH